MNNELKKLYNVILLDIDSINPKMLWQYDLMEFEEMISYLSRYYELNISSTDNIQILNDKIKLLNIKNYLTSIITTNNPEEKKNKPNFYNMVLNDINYSDLNKVLILGHDLNNEILGGIRTGIDTCLCDKSLTDFSGISPTYKIDSYEKIKTLF